LTNSRKIKIESILATMAVKKTKNLSGKS